eukprot:scaffold1347_cov350-Pavlova_lutheri.AAC.23
MDGLDPFHVVDAHCIDQQGQSSSARSCCVRDSCFVHRNGRCLGLTDPGEAEATSAGRTSGRYRHVGRLRLRLSSGHRVGRVLWETTSRTTPACAPGARRRAENHPRYLNHQGCHFGTGQGHEQVNWNSSNKKLRRKGRADPEKR